MYLTRPGSSTGLTARLEALGASTSGRESFLVHMFGMAPKTAQMGHEADEKTTQVRRSPIPWKMQRWRCTSL